MRDETVLLLLLGSLLFEEDDWGWVALVNHVAEGESHGLD